MTEEKIPFDENKIVRIVEIIDEVSHVDDELYTDSSLSRLSDAEREEVQQALTAQNLLAQLVDVAPPPRFTDENSKASEKTTATDDSARSKNMARSTPQCSDLCFSTRHT